MSLLYFLYVRHVIYVLETAPHKQEAAEGLLLPVHLVGPERAFSLLNLPSLWGHQRYHGHPLHFRLHVLFERQVRHRHERG
jgi:hypothetical protein